MNFVSPVRGTCPFYFLLAKTLFQTAFI